MKISRIPAILLVLLIFSCQQEKAQELAEKEVDFTNYTIDIQAKSIEFTDQVESVELLGFEESSESLLKPNMVYLKYEEGYILVDENLGTVFLFNEDGTFKRKFNRKGGGPEEYRNMQHTRYRDGLIETYVYETQKMMQYNLSGNFIQALDLPHQATDVIYFEKGYLLGMGNQFWLDSIDHDLVLTDNDMTPYAYTLPFNKPEGVPVKPPTNDFRIEGNRALFNPFWSDSVYQIKNDEVSPFIHFNFGEDWLWKEFPMTRSLDGPTINAMTDMGKVWAYDWVLGTNSIYMTYMTSLNLPPSVGYIDRLTKEFHHYDFGWSQSDGLPFKALRFEGDKLLVVFSTEVLGDFIDAVGDEKTESIGKLSNAQILESENPVLVWVKFK